MRSFYFLLPHEQIREVSCEQSLKVNPLSLCQNTLNIAAVSCGLRIAVIRTTINEAKFMTAHDFRNPVSTGFMARVFPDPR
jgi:hypothetical protein